jgi:unsaturated rhamnogalacturonyl hydrolase
MPPPRASCPRRCIGRQLLFPVTWLPANSAAYLVLPVPQACPPLAPADVKTMRASCRNGYDDFAWESDRIAHRTYGPAIMHVPNEHLISSGVDVWVKKVRTPVVDTWYKRGEYHQRPSAKASTTTAWATAAAAAARNLQPTAS